MNVWNLISLVSVCVAGFAVLFVALPSMIVTEIAHKASARARAGDLEGCDRIMKGRFYRFMCWALRVR